MTKYNLKYVNYTGLGPIDFNPLQYLFHATSLKMYKPSVTPYLLNAAKTLIPRFWKQSQCLNLQDWQKGKQRGLWKQKDGSILQIK